jgi:hypothetical protein
MNQRLVWNFEFLSGEVITLPEMVDEPDNLKWEIRYFWPEDRIIKLYNIDKTLLDLAQYKQKHKEDIYYLLPNNNYNIKRRRNELLFKPLLNQTTNACGFGPKLNLEELNDLADPDLSKIIHQVHSQGIEVSVKKNSFIYKFASTPLVKLELARLEVHGKIFFSACIEGKSLKLVETINEQLLDKNKNPSWDYVTFLKSVSRP